MNRVSPSQLWPTIAPGWMLNLPQWLEDIFYKMYKCFIYDDRYTMFAKGLGNKSDVSSPTFAIVNDYGGKPPFVHFDMHM